MDVQHELIGQLQERKILKQVEFEQLQNRGGDPQKFNMFILDCLYEKPYQIIVKFLRLLEETCQTHLLNYILNFKGIVVQ